MYKYVQTFRKKFVFLNSKKYYIIDVYKTNLCILVYKKIQKILNEDKISEIIEKIIIHMWKNILIKLDVVYK